MMTVPFTSRVFIFKLKSVLLHGSEVLSASAKCHHSATAAEFAALVEK
jgi:hypothetical protein